MIKHYPRIEHELYSRPWMITPNAHRVLSTAFQNHIKGINNIELPDVVDEEDDAKVSNIDPSVAVITIEGVIGKRIGMIAECMGGCDVDRISAEIDAVMADDNIKTVIFDMNTPGGTVVGVPELAAKISQISKTKHTIAYVDVLCASAGYYLASQTDMILCAPSAEIGSVGVYAIYIDESRAIEDAGIKVNAISAGTHKLAGASFKPMTDEERAMFQADVDRIYKDFKDAVSSTRNIKDEDMQGQVYSGDDVIIKGYADGNVNSLGELLTNLNTLLGQST